MDLKPPSALRSPCLNWRGWRYQNRKNDAIDLSLQYKFINLMRLPEKNDTQFRSIEEVNCPDSRQGKSEKLHAAIYTVGVSATSESRSALARRTFNLAAARLSIDQIEAFTPRFTSPQFHLGQIVSTHDGLIGYIAGLLFGPDTGGWEYSICLIHANHAVATGNLNEVWYTAKELTLCCDG